MRRARILGGLLAAALALAGCTSAAPTPAASDGISGTLRVYAAASLQRAFDSIAEEFEAAHPGAEVVPVYDGSATLATQIAAGAPADVFASADEATMTEVADAVEDPVVFATNTLVIAVPAADPAGIRSLADLPGRRVVLCAPQVPCGAASQRLLSAAGVKVTPVSEEQNVTAVLAKVAAGEADAGLVYATDTKANADVEAIVPAGAADVVNRYPIAALREAANPAAAAAFVAFVRSDVGRTVLDAAGFGAP
ncbi:molybdate ABC transporter substrate-binding protein [Microbacterium sp. 10M-3C3]|jgi:molybdate transport system substrate-binding protein|uniref:molybdate ABC transporter substrate-binding protein n=1 Tax=Microbacterium sp. 10M-3C3 TaxID=2483401 RepID=UPI000F62CEB9|nr:molybdate ABC transporter substrate-binding protein [Microbacterium sp. 10M-3C3]